MREYGKESAAPSFNVQGILLLLRAAGAVLGLVAIVLGLVYATRMFALVFSALKAPEVFQAHLAQWFTAVGAEHLDLVVAGTTVPLGRIVAILVVGGGAILLAWIAMGLMLAGAKTVSWTASDQEAIKRMLVHAFGPARKPEVNRSVGRDATDPFQKSR